MFWLRFLRLLASVVWEGIYSAVCLVVFLVPGRVLAGQRSVVRERVRKLMSEPVSPAMRKNLWVFLCSLAVVLGALGASGCRTAHIRGSFGAQVDNLVWSAERLADQSGDLDSLAGDVGMLLEPEWGELEDTFRLLGW